MENANSGMGMENNNLDTTTSHMENNLDTKTKLETTSNKSLDTTSET